MLVQFGDCEGILFENTQAINYQVLHYVWFFESLEFRWLIVGVHTDVTHRFLAFNMELVESTDVGFQWLA